MDKPRCRQPIRFKRLIAFLRRRCLQTVPTSWLDDPPADPDIGVREPRRPQPHGGAGTVLLDRRERPGTARVRFGRPVRLDTSSVA